MNNHFDKFIPCLTRPVTRRQAFKTFGLGLAGMALARFGLNEAHAITNGQLDGDAHPNVGGFVWLTNIWSPDPPPVCVGTGSLIHPRVVLTAGHGTYAVESAIASGMMTMDDLLISFASDATQPATWRSISAVLTHPGYADKPEGNGDVPVADVGVAILKEPVNNLPLTPLPPQGFLDALQAAGQLKAGSKSAQFTVVGYGAVLGDNNGHWPFPPDGQRRIAQSGFHNLHDRWLFLDQNPALDLGGTGGGDSGGPNYWINPVTGDSTLVAITSRGSWTLETQYRVDTAEALSFLNDVLWRVNHGQL
jgi:hypothetical protein